MDNPELGLCSYGDSIQVVCTSLGDEFLTATILRVSVIGSQNISQHHWRQSASWLSLVVAKTVAQSPLYPSLSCSCEPSKSSDAAASPAHPVRQKPKALAMAMGNASPRLELKHLGMAISPAMLIRLDDQRVLSLMMSLVSGEPTHILRQSGSAWRRHKAVARRKAKSCKALAAPRGSCWFWVGSDRKSELMDCD